MSDVALFDLDDLTREKGPTWPGCRHEYWRDDYRHIEECLHFECPDCGVDPWVRGRPTDVMDYVAFHGAPSGYRHGYCYFQRNSWERVAECIECHTWWFGNLGCWNEACSLHAVDRSAIIGRAEDWHRWFYPETGVSEEVR